MHRASSCTGAATCSVSSSVRRPENAATSRRWPRSSTSSSPGCSSPTSKPCSWRPRAAQGAFHCSSHRDVTEALELAAWIARRGGDLEAFYAGLSTLTPEALAAAAARHLAPDERYSLSSTPLLGNNRALPGLIFLLVLALATFAYMFRDRLRLMLRRRRPRGRVIAMPKRTPMPPVDGDDLEADIQKFFEQEDRSRDDS